MEIALPPDGFFQKVFYKKIDPQPLQIRIDNDGNWLATFLLSPRQKTEVKAEGYAQIFPLLKNSSSHPETIWKKHTSSTLLGKQ